MHIDERIAELFLNILACLFLGKADLQHLNAHHKAETVVTLHVRDLVHGFRAVISTTPQWMSGLNSRSEGTAEE